MKNALGLVVLAAGLAVTAGAAPAAQEGSAVQAPAPASAAPAPAAAESLTPEQRLVRVRRLYVESFGDDPISKQMQSMVVDSLMKTKRFVVTENRDRADAILKGTAVEQTSQELHAFSESGAASTAVAGGHAEHSSDVSGSLHGSSVNGTGTVTGSVRGSARGSANSYGRSVGAAVEDSQVTTETIDDARISVRLVDPDGDILWTTTQESTGAKYKGASADAADKVAKQLMRELERIERGTSAP
jgi:curli biogenesis system outer membrane secretion channel CsgG